MVHEVWCMMYDVWCMMFGVLHEVHVCIMEFTTPAGVALTSTSRYPDWVIYIYIYIYPLIIQSVAYTFWL